MDKENKQPEIDYNSLTREQRDELERYERDTKQLKTLEDIALTSQQMASLMGREQQSRTTLVIDHVTSDEFARLFEDLRSAISEFSEKESAEMPDYATPVVKAVSKLESQLKSLKIEVPTPQVNVKAPEVTVQPTKVDLSGIEKTLNIIPAEFKKAIQSIPKVDIPKPVDRWDEILERLESIDVGTRIKPQAPSTLKVTNTDGTRIGGIQPISNFDYIDVQQTSSSVDTYVYKLGGASGTVIRTIVVTYVDNTKNDIDFVTYG